MEGRTLNFADYRYGFNGKEADTNREWGSLTHYDYGFRIYNPAIARFLSVDPLTRKYPELTPYQFASNTPIQAIDLDGLEAFFIHGTDEGVYGERFRPESKRELLRITGNSQLDRDFLWNAPLTNNALTRNISARRLVYHIYKRRNEMIQQGKITEDEGISLVGYSHGGNVAIQAARKLGKLGIKVNLVTISTPAYNTDWKDAYGGGLDSEDPRGAMDGINAHYQIVHESDDVVDIAGGTEEYTNPSTQNYIITNEQIPFVDGINAHVNLPNSEKLDEALKEIPAMPKSPKPIFPEPNPKKE
jgi:RHS repeat-associated protein